MGMIPAVIEIGKRDGLLVFRIVDFCLYQIGKIIVTKLPAEPPKFRWCDLDLRMTRNRSASALVKILWCSYGVLSAGNRGGSLRI